ncbi:MAG: replication initiation factor domain-containing protein [Burkholderiales bacterium]
MVNSASVDSPRSVIRGESKKVVPELSVSVDFLSFTLSGGHHESVFAELCALVGAYETEEKPGLYGYDRRSDAPGLGFVCSGGESQRGSVFVSISGAGCQRIADMRKLRAWAEPLGARITRLDVCADDHDAEVMDVRGAIDAWRDGSFVTRGRPPKARHVDDLESGQGQTLYVGSRASGKFCRIYEKGKQLGDALSRWVRGEVEFHNKDRVIPWDAVTNPAPYLAGAFPYFAVLSLVQERIRTFKATAEITLESLKKWVRMAAGKSVNALLRHFDGDVSQVVFAVRRDGLPARLGASWEVMERHHLPIGVL